MASILVGSCRLILFFCLPLLLCSRYCNLPLLAQFFLAYAPFYLVFTYFFYFPIVLFMYYSRNSSMCYDGYMIFSTSAWPLVLSLFVLRTVHWQRFSSGFSSFISSLFGNFSIIFIICSWRYTHIISFSRHHDVIPYGSRGQGKSLKISFSSSVVKMQGLKILYKFNGYS